MPMNFGVNQLVPVAGQAVQIGLGGRYWADAPATGPDGFGLRANPVFLFPR